MSCQANKMLFNTVQFNNWKNPLNDVLRPWSVVIGKCISVFAENMSTENEETLDINGAANTEPSKEKRIGCAHYKRRAKFVVSFRSQTEVYWLILDD